MASGDPYLVGLSSAVLKGAVVSIILDVIPVFLVLNAARPAVRAVLYLAMAAASAFWEASSDPSSTAGVRWIAVSVLISGSPNKQDKEQLTRHGEQGKVPCAGVVQNLELSEVGGHDLLDDLVVVRLPPRVTHIVDTNPDAEQRVVAPGRIAGLLGNAVAELLDLVNEAEDGRLVGRDDGGVGGGTAVGKVVGQESGPVVLRGEEANPVQATAGGPPGQRGVTERVARGWLGALDIEARLGVRVAKSDEELDGAVIRRGAAGARCRARGRARAGRGRQSSGGDGGGGCGLTRDTLVCGIVNIHLPFNSRLFEHSRYQSLYASQ